MSARMPVRLKSFEDKPRYARFHLEGYLDKRASKGVGVRWQTRYFRTVNNMLIYTDKKESPPSEVHKIFDITGMNELALAPQDPTNCQLLLGFKGISGLLHLRAATAEDCNKWINGLSKRQSFLEEESQAQSDIKASASGPAGKPHSLELATTGLRFAIDNLTARHELATAMSIAVRAGIGLKSALYTEAEARLVQLGGVAEDVATRVASAQGNSADTGSGSGSSGPAPVEQTAEDQFFNVLDSEPIVDTDFERFLKEIGVGDYVGIASLLESNNYVDPASLSVLEDWQLELLGVPVEDIAAIVSSEALKERREEAARARRAAEEDAARAAGAAAAAAEYNGGFVPADAEDGQAGRGAGAGAAGEATGAGAAKAGSEDSTRGTCTSGFANDLHARTGRATIWRCLQAGAHVRDKPMGKQTRNMEMGELITQAASDFADNRLWIGFYDKLDTNSSAAGGEAVDGGGGGGGGGGAPLRWTVTTDRKVQNKLKLEPLIESKHSALVSKGANVEVKYGAGQGNWTKATVLAINADDTLKVRYRDGEIEKGVKQMHVRVSVETRHQTLHEADASLLRLSPGSSSMSSRAVPDKDRLVEGVDYHQKLTVVLLGNSNVGKSSMMQRYVTREFQASQMNTIGIDHRDVLVESGGTRAGASGARAGDKHVTLLSIWDTAGQERFANLSRNYVRRMDCIVLCFDITSSESFQGINRWTSFLQESIDTKEKAVFLVGTKMDLADDRIVTRGEAEALAAQLQPLLGDVPYFECSAKTGQSVNTIFESLVPFWKRKHEGDAGNGQAEEEDHQQKQMKQSTSLASLTGYTKPGQSRKACC